MKIHESAEDYLETILILSQKGISVRSIDVVNEMDFTKPSVSVAMKKLRESGYVNVDGDGHITLTPEGRVIAEKMLERHNYISNLLMELGVDRETALADACRIEHVISEQSFEAIKRLGILYSKK